MSHLTYTSNAYLAFLKTNRQAIRRMLAAFTDTSRSRFRKKHQPFRSDVVLILAYSRALLLECSAKSATLLCKAR